MTHEPTMTHEHAHTALCLWEAWLETDEGTDWSLYRSVAGAVQSRFACIDMASTVEAVWALLPEEVRDTCCYDWEFVPAMLSRFDYGGRFPRLNGTTQAVAAAFAEGHQP